MIAPETHNADYNPYGGSQPSYYVTINTHVSGNFTTQAPAQSAVAIISAQITDANGNIVYENKITAASSQGQTLDNLHCQAAQGINAYIQGIIRK